MELCGAGTPARVRTPEEATSRVPHVSRPLRDVGILIFAILETVAIFNFFVIPSGARNLLSCRTLVQPSQTPEPSLDLFSPARTRHPKQHPHPKASIL